MIAMSKLQLSQAEEKEVQRWVDLLNFLDEAGLVGIAVEVLILGMRIRVTKALSVAMVVKNDAVCEVGEGMS